MSELDSQTGQTAQASRAVLIHGHMYKNAGTTLDWSLQRSFGAGFVDHRDDKAMKEGADYLQRYLHSQPAITALSSHWLTFELPKTGNPDYHLLMLFRDPMQRMQSVYHFERRQREATVPEQEWGKWDSFADYVRLKLRPQAGPVIKNYQTRYCSGDYFGTDLARMFDAAVARIDATLNIGLVDRYAQSMALFEYNLATAYPKLDLSWQVQNRSEEGTGKDGDAIYAQIETELGALWDEALAANQYDLKLLEYVRSRFERSMAELPDQGARLQQLHARNALLL
ncbi:MAG: hypothetical protein V7746_11090 [Halioglobus sp.]